MCALPRSLVTQRLREFTDGLKPAFPTLRTLRPGYQNGRYAIRARDALRDFVKPKRAVVRDYKGDYRRGWEDGHRRFYSPEAVSFIKSLPREMHADEKLLRAWVHQDGANMYRGTNAEMDLVLVPNMYKHCFRRYVDDEDSETPYLDEHAYLRRLMNRQLKSTGIWTFEDDKKARDEMRRMIYWGICKDSR